MARIIETKENEEIGLYTKDFLTNKVVRVGEFSPNGGGLVIGSAGIDGVEGTEDDNIKFHRGGSGVLQLVLGSDNTPDGKMAPNSSLAKIQGVSNFSYVVGSESQFVSGEATHSSLASAVSGGVSGSKILIIGKTGDLLSDTVTISNKVFIEGVGSDAEINCNLVFGTTSNTTSSKSLVKYVNFLGDLTIDEGSNNNIVTDCWIAADKKVTDLNTHANNLISVVKETLEVTLSELPGFSSDSEATGNMYYNTSDGFIHFNNG